MQNDIKKETVKKSALSSGKIDKYEYLTGTKILPSNRRQTIKQAKITYYPLGKALEKQTEKQVGALKSRSFSDKTDELQ